jgi:hypothetical protein
VCSAVMHGVSDTFKTAARYGPRVAHHGHRRATGCDRIGGGRHGQPRWRSTGGWAWMSRPMPTRRRTWKSYCRAVCGWPGTPKTPSGRSLWTGGRATVTARPMGRLLGPALRSRARPRRPHRRPIRPPPRRVRLTSPACRTSVFGVRLIRPVCRADVSGVSDDHARRAWTRCTREGDSPAALARVRIEISSARAEASPRPFLPQPPRGSCHPRQHPPLSTACLNPLVDRRHPHSVTAVFRKPGRRSGVHGSVVTGTPTRPRSRIRSCGTGW